MTAPTLTVDQRYWLTAANADYLTYRDGLFTLGRRLQPEPKAQEIRALIFLGLLAKNGDLIETTTEGKRLLTEGDHR